MDRKHLNRMKRIFKADKGIVCKKYKKVGNIKAEVIYELRNKDEVLYVLLYQGHVTTYADSLDYFIEKGVDIDVPKV